MREKEERERKRSENENIKKGEKKKSLSGGKEFKRDLLKRKKWDYIIGHSKLFFSYVSIYMYVCIYIKTGGIWVLGVKDNDPNKIRPALVLTNL